MTIVGARNPGRVRMKVVKAATVSGSVSLPDGTPLAGATVRANSSTLGADYLSSLPHESVTGRDGKFHCIVGPGELRQVMVTKLPDSVANDYLTRDVLPKISSYNQHPRLSPGQHYQHPPMKLTPPRTISGLVVDENDRPVSNAWVRSNRSRDHARTDKAGAFSMRVTSDFTRLEFIQPEGSSLRSRFYVTTELQRGVVGTIESRNPYRIRIRNDEPIVETSPRLQQALMKAIKPLQLRNASLKDVVKEFKRGTRIDAYIDEEQLRAAGRSPDTIRITASTRSQTLQRTLRDVLEPHGLTWREGKTGDGSSGASMSGPRILEDPDITIVPLTSGTR